jgi:tetratricopeptide (TPR) repeat protein
LDKSNKIKQIFLSYAWANMEVADAVERELTNLGLGITLLRDIRDIGYKSSIKEFMHRVGKSDYVLMLISNEYLQSENCMYEVTELLNSHEFEKRILPIILESANGIFSPSKREQYYVYWDQKLNEAKERTFRFISADFLEVQRKIQGIQMNLDLFFSKITDLNIIPYAQLKQKGFKPLLQIIGINDKGLLEELYKVIQEPNPDLKEALLNELLIKYPGNEHIYYQKAYSASAQKKYILAVQYYNKTIQANKNSFEGYIGLGAILSNNFSEHEEAILDFEQAISINPRAVLAYLNLATVYVKLNKIDKAVEQCEKLISFDPQNIEAYDRLANIHLRHTKNFNKAKEIYEKSLSLNTDDGTRYGNFGFLLQYQFKKPEEALEQYKKAIELGTNNQYVYYDTGVILATRYNDKEGARKYLMKAIEINPDFYNAHVDMGILMEDYFEDYGVAMEYYEKAIAIEPGNVRGYNSLAELQIKYLKDIPAARKNLEKALSLNPDDANTLLNLGIFYSQYQVDDHLAKTYYEEFIKRGAESEHLVSAHINLGKLLSEKFDRFDEAKNHIEKAISLNPERAGSYVSLAKILYHNYSQIPEARSAYEKALSINPENMNALTGLGAIFCDKLKDYEKARELFEKAIFLNAEDFTANFNMGTLLTNTSEFEKATILLIKALEIDPSKVITHLKLASLYQNHLLDYERTVFHLKKAVELEPSRFYLHKEIADILSEHFDDYEGARIHMEMAVKDKPEMYYYHFQLAELLGDKLKYHREAITHFKRALELNPAMDFLYIRIGRELNALHDYDGAIGYYLEYIQLHPDNAEAHASAAVILGQKSGRNEEVKYFLEKSIELDPSKAYNYFNLGYLAQEAKNYSEAITQYEKCLERNPKHLRAYFNLALIQTNIFSNFPVAKKYYEKILELNPDEAEAHVNLGLILSNVYKDHYGAKAHYETAIQINPNLKQANDNLKGLLERNLIN